MANKHSNLLRALADVMEADNAPKKRLARKRVKRKPRKAAAPAAPPRERYGAMPYPS